MVGKFHKNTLSVLYTFVLHVGSSTVMNIEGRIILDICNIVVSELCHKKC